MKARRTFEKRYEFPKDTWLEVRRGKYIEFRKQDHTTDSDTINELSILFDGIEIKAYELVDEFEMMAKQELEKEKYLNEKLISMNQEHFCFEDKQPAEHPCLETGHLMPYDRNKHVLLQLQKIRVYSSQEIEHDITVLWDGGSTLSFITFRKAEELKLEKHRETQLQIERVGGDIHNCGSYRYQLKLKDRTGAVETLSVLGIDKISSDIVGINCNQLYSKFTGLKQKDIDRPNRGEIECLIGYDYAGFHPVRKRVAGHLLLLQNKFGFVIGGTSSG